MQRKRLSYADLYKQGELNQDSVSDSVYFHSKILRINKYKPFSHLNNSSAVRDATWYLKVNIPYKDAIREVVAQELFRLFIPNQTKTRLIEPEKPKDKFGVISKHVEGYLPLSDIEDDDLIVKTISGKYYGIGEVFVIALLVDEFDLKPDNLCLNNKKQVIKLDGDRAFITLSEWGDSGEVTEADIQRLPCLVTYKAANWLDFYMTYAEDKDNKITKDVDGPVANALAESVLVRIEINRALMKLLLIPQDVIKEFIGSYIDDESEKQLQIDEIIRRKKMICDAALKNESFRNYLLTPLADKHLDAFIKYICEFKTTGKNELHVAADGEYMKRQLTRNRNTINAQNNKAQHGLFGGGKRKADEDLQQQVKRRTLR